MGPLRVETSRVRAASQKNLVVGNGPDLTADWGWKLDGSSSWLRRLRQEEKSRVARGVGGSFVGSTAGVEAETALVVVAPCIPKMSRVQGTRTTASNSGEGYYCSSTGCTERGIIIIQFRSIVRALPRLWWDNLTQARRREAVDRSEPTMSTTPWPLWEKVRQSTVGTG
jgi:hypothetical protein